MSREHFSSDAKERILRAALAVFMEKGKYGARMQEIADKANINKAMLHYYFTDKDTLYEKSIEHVFISLFTRIGNVFAEDIPFVCRIERFVNSYMDFFQENMGITRLIARELADGAHTFNKVRCEPGNRDVFFAPQRIKQLFEEAKFKGEVRDVDAVQTMLSIIGMCLFYFMAKPVIDPMWGVTEENENDFIQARKKSIIDFVIHALKVEHHLS